MTHEVGASDALGLWKSIPRELSQKGGSLTAGGPVHCASSTSSSQWWLAPGLGEEGCRGLWCLLDLEEGKGVVGKTDRGDGLWGGER